MDYFLLKQLGTISIPREKKHEPGESSVRVMENVASLRNFDYIAAESLVSDRVKLLLEQYLPEQEWQTCAFVDPQKQEQETFWFLPPISYVPEDVGFANGLPCSVTVNNDDFAEKSSGIFYIPNPKGTPFVIVHLSVAESILRRGFCGLLLERLPGRSGSGSKAGIV